MFKLHCVAALKDNYIWLLEDDSKKVIIVDPSESEALITYINLHQLIPEVVLLTHHHDDHIGGVLALKQEYPTLECYGPNDIKLPITYLKNTNDRVFQLKIANKIIDVFKTPGHTLSHVSYYLKPYLFCADTLFSAGCGRLFEGTHQQMLNSLNLLKQLPDETIVCPAHEYTLGNLRFAKNYLPEDENIKTYYDFAKSNAKTLPTTLSFEKKINLFLRCDEQALQQKFNVNNEYDLFKFLRIEKDNF